MQSLLKVQMICTSPDPFSNRLISIRLFNVLSMFTIMIITLFAVAEFKTMIDDLLIRKSKS